MARLSIDIDKIAVLRKLGNGKTPDPFHTAAIAEITGVDGITVRLKETNSAITNRDLHLLKNAVHTSLNIEMPCNDAMLETALKISPDMITFVAVDDQGDSSDNTVDLNIEYDKIAEAIPRLQMQDILISLHIEPEVEMVKAAAKLKADYIQLSTYSYANNTSAAEQSTELEKISSMVSLASKLLLGINCARGIDYRNVKPLTGISSIEELSVGQAVIGQALYVGLEQAIREMLLIVQD